MKVVDGTETKNVDKSIIIHDVEFQFPRLFIIGHANTLT